MPVPDWLGDNKLWEAYLVTALAKLPWSAYPAEFFARLLAVSKRGRLVAWRIFEDGQTNTEVLTDQHDYGHAPRAARDIKDCGIRIESGRGRHSRTLRPMAIYSFADPTTILMADQAGRAALSNDFVVSVFAAADHQCALCAGRFEARFLQADHCIPYAIAGDELDAPPAVGDFMAVCRSCNRAKSWTCENCPNWAAQDRAVCASCYWASPLGYAHIATEPMRQLRLVWQGEEVGEFDLTKAVAQRLGQDLPSYVKDLLNQIAAASQNLGQSS